MLLASRLPLAVRVTCAVALSPLIWILSTEWIMGTVAFNSPEGSIRSSSAFCWSSRSRPPALSIYARQELSNRNRFISGRLFPPRPYTSWLIWSSSPLVDAAMPPSIGVSSAGGVSPAGFCSLSGAGSLSAGCVSSGCTGAESEVWVSVLWFWVAVFSVVPSVALSSSSVPQEVRTSGRTHAVAARILR